MQTVRLDGTPVIDRVKQGTSHTTLDMTTCLDHRNTTKDRADSFKPDASFESKLQTTSRTRSARTAVSSVIGLEVVTVELSDVTATSVE